MERNWIGSSDISAVMGMNPWKTPLMLWSEKTGKIEPKDLSDNEAVEWGTRLERIVSQKFSEKNSVKLIAYKKRFVHPEHDFLSCELDNIIAGTDEIVEIKTCNAWAYNDWKEPDQIPAHYILQVMFALGLSKRKIGHIAVLIGGQRYIEKKIDFDQDLFDTMIEQAVTFWKMVQDKTEPMAMGDDSEFMIQLHPENDDQMQEVEEMNDSIALLQTVKATIKDALDQKKEVEAKLKQVIGENMGIETSEYKLTWKKQSTTRLDTKNLKEEQPEIYNRYAYASDSRVLRVRKT